MHVAGKYLSVTTYRRDGTGVATPVWFVEDEGRFLVKTGAESGKVKRIRHNPSVTAAACNGMGKVRGEPFAARADFVPAAEQERVDTLMRHKYRVDGILVMPVYRLVMRLKGHPVGHDEAYLAITPSS
jgi:PPOX class probable F420-dependent enzyme